LRVVGDLKGKGLFVSLFIDPDIKQIKSAKVTKADMLEIHTGGYTEAKIYDKREKEFKKIEEAVKTTLEQGLKVAAGHGLNYTNVKSISSIVGIEELNIGHSIIARSVFVGVERAVREMLELCK
jgi:pyridoxine 5-phosphate synthase